MKNLAISILMLLLCNLGYAQSTNCAVAVWQLQSYAAQINQTYSYEYWTAIPNFRCPAFDAWGNPYFPQVVQNCRWQMYTSLNYWYAQQCKYVNDVYRQIVQGCAAEETGRYPSPAPIINGGGEKFAEIDSREFEDLKAGVDENKAVRIEIPTTAAGFKPKNK